MINFFPSLFICFDLGIEIKLMDSKFKNKDDEMSDEDDGDDTFNEVYFNN